MTRTLCAACWFVVAIVCACADEAVSSNPEDAGPAIDASSASNTDEPSFDSSGNSPCRITDEFASCASQPIETIDDGGADPRRVYWNQPTGKAPKAGRPAVILFQGSNYGPSMSWNVDLPKSTPFGGYYQLALIALLVDNGFVVIQPEAAGGRVWMTNIPGSDYAKSADAAFIPKLLGEIEGGAFGSVDMTRLYATGISSGGYMASRMAVSYAGRFRALAIQSASYATCLGPLCTVPKTLSTDHPPTLLLHGAMDTIVPIATAKAYYAALEQAGIETSFVQDASAGHQWLEASPVAITKWFSSH